MTAPIRLLILGGSTEAGQLAAALAGRDDIAATLSLAGRTQRPAASPVPCRVGGFGGIDGLVDYLRREVIGAVVDATHPFAARMSAHAAAACAAIGVPRARFTREAWTAEPGDRWTSVGSIADAPAALGSTPRRVLLTTGRLDLAVFRTAPQHRYIARMIDPPEPSQAPPDIRVVLARGPFTLMDELYLLGEQAIEVVVAKNSGGDATVAKLDAARRLGLPVIMVEQPAPPAGAIFTRLDEVLAWIEAQT